MIKFECRCGQAIEAPDELLGEQVQCPTCKEKFWPEKFLPAPPQKPSAATKPAINRFNHPALRAPEPVTAEKIKRQARSFERLSFCLVFLGALVLILEIVASIGQSGIGSVFWLVIGSLFVTAFWVYTVAQIIHIRANTEK